MPLVTNSDQFIINAIPVKIDNDIDIDQDIDTNR